MTNVASFCDEFPSSPNWFDSSISAVSKSLDLYVYASRNRIVALDASTLRVKRSFIASQHKIHAIAVHDQICATTGQDKAIRCWNLDTGKLENGHARHQTDIHALCWARNGTILLSGDKSGSLTIWDRPQGTLASKVHINSSIKCISHTAVGDEDIIALGYANGMIIVGKLNAIQQFETLYRLENHIDEIQSLQWQHFVAFEPANGWPMLASGSKDASVVIWDVPHENVYERITPPRDKQLTSSQMTRVFTVCCWATHKPERLFFSSFNGEIAYIDVNGPTTQANKRRRYTEIHNRSVFGMDIVDDGRSAISHSMDRTVVKWETDTMKKMISVKTIGGIPYSMDIGSADVTKMAVALSDSNIKIWNVPIASEAFDSRSHAGELYQSVNIWKGLKGKITKLKWHPVKEGFLAYGTEHGSVMLLDTYIGKITSFKSYHKATIYSLQWVVDSGAFALAAEPSGPTQGPWLLSCEGQSILVHDATKPSKQAININEVLSFYNQEWIKSVEEKGMMRCDVAVDNNMGFLAIGNSDGSIEVYSLKSLKLIYTANNQTKPINSMAWKPEGDGQHSFLATGSVDTTICIHYIGDKNESNIQDIPVPASSFVQLYRGHLGEITDIVWQHGASDFRLASASNDGNILIWNLSQPRPVHNIRRIGRILSLCWSPTIPDTLFSGGEDHAIYTWNTKYLQVMNDTDQIIKRPASSINLNYNMITKKSQPTVKTVDKTEVKNVPAKRTAEQQQNSRSSTPSRKRAKGADADSSIFECLNMALDGTGNAAESVLADMLSEAKRKLAQLDTTKRDEVIDACSHIPPKDLSAESLPLASALFRDKNSVRDMIDEEVASYSKISSSRKVAGINDTNASTAFDPKFLFDVLRNQHESIEGHELRTGNTTLDDWVALALCPMFSREMWEQKILQLAAKLDANNSPQASAMCYLAAFQVYPAIDVYRRAKLYKEAIALAKTRLPEGDTIVSELFNEWGADLEARSQFELAAKCYLQSKRPGYEVNTLNALARPNDDIALYWSAAVAVALNDPSATERRTLWIAELERQI